MSFARGEVDVGFSAPSLLAEVSLLLVTAVDGKMTRIAHGPLHTGRQNGPDRPPASPAGQSTVRGLTALLLHAVYTP
jgi:hypothetical protein